MVTPTEGSVILVPFPFSDLSQANLRPAVVLADVGRGDSILCQITSKPYGDSAAIRLEDSNFSKGSLRITSYARPGKLFTANKELLVSQVAELKAEAFEGIIEATVSILRAGLRRWKQQVPAFPASYELRGGSFFLASSTRSRSMSPSFQYS